MAPLNSIPVNAQTVIKFRKIYLTASLSGFLIEGRIKNWKSQSGRIHIGTKNW